MNTKRSPWLGAWLVVGLAGLSWAGQGPKLAVAEKEISFGEIVQGEIVELRVPLQNEGDAPLRITRASASCECTVGSFPEAPIPPGESGDLVLVFDSSQKRGMQSFQIEVYSNDPSQHDRGQFVTMLTLRGEVRTVYRSVPGGAFFGEFVRDEEPSTRTIKIVGHDEAKGGFTAQIMNELPDYVTATVVPFELESPRVQRGVQVDVTLAPHAPQGELSLVLELETSVETQPKLRLPVMAIVTGAFNGPDFVQLLRVRRGAPVTRRLAIERRGKGEGLPILGVDFDKELFEVSLEALSTNRSDLVLALRPQVRPGSFASTLRIQLDDPKQPFLDIPVFGHVLPLVQVEPPGLILDPSDSEPHVLVVRGATVTGASGPEGLQVTVLEAGGEDALGRVQVEVTASPESDGVIVIETNVPGEERIEIPVRSNPGD